MATRTPRRNASAEAAPSATFEVLSNLSLDNEDYVPGDTVELTEEQALAIGPQVVKPVTVAAE